MVDQQPVPCPHMAGRNLIDGASADVGVAVVMWEFCGIAIIRIYFGIWVVIDDYVDGGCRAQRVVQRPDRLYDGSGIVVADPLAVPKLALMKAGIDAEEHVAGVGLECGELPIRPIETVRQRR